MASSDAPPKPTPLGTGGVGGPTPPGEPTTMGSQVLDMGAAMMQAMKPIKEISQHLCSFALYAHDLSRQIETHHFASRLNQDVVQCAVYDSDDATGKLIGVEYILSERLFESLPPEEQLMWHSHAHEVKSGLLVHPRVPEAASKPELRQLASTYGKFWCTWQVDRGDRLPMGCPALMASPQAQGPARVRPDLLQSRDGKYRISSDEFKRMREDIEVPTMTNPNADYCVNMGKGLAVDLVEEEMKRVGPAMTTSAAAAAVV